MARVVVTGATGFIGSHLVEKLRARGDEVTCLVRKTPCRAMPGMRLAYGDVCQPESLTPALNGAEVVYHLAGKVQALSAREMLAVNATGVENIARACASLVAPPVLVVVSSLAAAGPSAADRPRSEADPPLPISRYGISKREGELAAARWASRVPISIVRPPVVIGEGDPKGIPLFRPIVRWGIHPVPGASDWRLSLIHVDDLCDAMIRIAERGERLAPCDGDARARGVYFAADDGVQPTYGELGELIGRAAGRSAVRVLALPRPMVWLAAAAAELAARTIRRALIFNFDKVREANAGSWTCSAQAIRDQLGFAPALPLAERLTQTAAWYRRQGWV